MPNKKTATRDPIRDKPLRDPGQGLREYMQDRYLDTVLPWLLIVVLAFTLAAMEWVRWMTNSPYTPITWSVMAIVAAVLAVWRCRLAIQDLTRHKLGLKGERAVGQYLQAMLLPEGYYVIHDIVIDNFNIDHVAIGPSGVFAIETKTRSKPRGDARITYDGNRVLVDGWAPDRDPVTQAKACAKSLQKILEQFTGQHIDVRPAVVYPGWYVEPQPPGVATWVLNEKALPKFIENEPKKLNSTDIRVLAEGLARYVRERLT
jgi:hypothetical protein